jgi:hypothetical protein
MNALDPSALALGFFAVIGLGLLAMYAGIHLRRVHTAQRITARWTAWNKANAAYLDAQLADVPPPVHSCSFGESCAHNVREADRQLRAERIRKASR